MIVRTLTVGDMIPTNSYFYINEKTKHGFLIDPAAEASLLIGIIKKENWTIEKMLLTHGHFDHIGAVAEIHNKLNIPYYIHQNGHKYLTNSGYNLSIYSQSEIILNDGHYLQDADEIILEENPTVRLQVLYVPGHTTDSVIYYDKKNALAFVGDTIFKGNVGATHFPGGNAQRLYQSIREKIFTLPDNTKLYSGHSGVTTVAEEKKLY